MTKKQDEQNSLIECLRKVFVSIEVFELRLSPVEKIVYGATGAVLLAFLGAIIGFFITRK